MLRYQTTRLNNGLRVLTAPVPDTKTFTLLIMVGAGSRYETTENQGISHFLEHLFFKGGKKYTKPNEVAYELDKIGASYNAFTGKEYAGYWVKTAQNHRQLTFEILSDMVLHARLPEKEIEKERGVIIEEINVYEDLPISKVSENFDLMVFGDNNAGRDILGTKKIVKNLKRPDMIRYKENLYTPDNMVVLAAGKIDKEEVLSNVKKYFPLPKKKKSHTFSPPVRQDRKRLHLQYKKTEQAHLVFGFPTIPALHPDRYAQSIISIILGGNMSSRLFAKMRQELGAAYYIHTSRAVLSDCGHLAAYTGVNLAKTQLAISEIIAEFQKISKNLKDSEVQNAKEFLKGQTALWTEDRVSVAEDFAKEELLYGKIESYEYYLKQTEKVTAEQVKAFAKKYFRPDNAHLAVIGPFKDQKPFAKLLTP